MPIHQEFLINAFDSFPANVALLDAAGQVLAVNGEMTEFDVVCGVPTKATGCHYVHRCEQSSCYQSTDPHQSPSARITQALQHILSGELKRFEYEYPCHLENKLRFFVIRISPFIHQGERFILVIHENITERKLNELEIQSLNQMLEQKVQRRTRDLENAKELLILQNKELEQRNTELSRMIFAASHQLQEPLRIIGVFADLLEHRMQPLLNQKTAHYIEIIGQQVKRARTVVSEVLAIEEKHFIDQEIVDFTLLWQELSQDLNWPQDARYHCEALPSVSADKEEMRQLLANLLTNAIQFRSERPLHVSLRGSIRGDMAHFVLTDNGIGIPQEQRERVFGMFYRVHQKPSSSGIGLSLCQKIIKKYNGDLWITGGRQGTRLHFLLPAA